MMKTIKQRIDADLARFLKSSRNTFAFKHVSPLLFNAIEEFVLRPGKRIRPILAILSYRGYTRSPKHVPQAIYNAAISIELLHAFMLIHDDIIDQSWVRRGKPTLHQSFSRSFTRSKNEKLGNDIGIIAGDIVYAFAIESITRAAIPPDRKNKAIAHLIRTTINTAIGEYLDTVNGIRSIKDVPQKSVLLNYNLKTAQYTFECPLILGALLAGVPETEIKKLKKIGTLIGEAFQIQDDIIGIFGTQKQIGKSILSDLAEQKKTLLTCYAYQTLRANQRKTFLKLFNKPQKTYRDLVAVRSILVSGGSLEYCLNNIHTRLKQSAGVFEKLTMKKNYREEIKESLISFFAPSNGLAQKHGLPNVI